MTTHSIRKAKLADVTHVQALINSYASGNKMLPRSLHDIYECLRDFHVCVEDERIIGVCALHITWDNLAEIRSLAVAEDRQRHGIGSELVLRCLEEAADLGLTSIFTLTYSREFFAKLGFLEVDKAMLPHKVWADCIRCPQFPNCSETAMTLEMRK
ncbi:MAG: N-acetyltransferase [Nitrospirae bacterium]|nr:N-acetyltransferase [Nitrospirota bacterium]